MCVCMLVYSYIKSMCDGDVQKVQTVIQGLQKKLVNHEGRRQTLFQQLQDNTSKLHLLHAQATAAAGDNKASILSQVWPLT